MICVLPPRCSEAIKRKWNDLKDVRDVKKGHCRWWYDHGSLDVGLSRHCDAADNIRLSLGSIEGS